MQRHTSVACASSVAVLFLGIVLLSSNVREATGALLAIDLGSEFLKISLVKPGRAPIAIVLNEMSKRKTPAAVAFSDGDRLLGEEAASLVARYPDRVYVRTRELLGKFANDTSVQDALKKRYLPYDIVPDAARGTINLKTHKGEVYSIETVVGSILYHAKQLAKQAAEGFPVVDCVITAPAYFGQNQRQALIDAAELSGLNVLGLVNNHAAAALQYGIERDFTNNSETVILYDMGSSSVEVALVEFSSFSIKEGSKVNTYGQFVVKDVAWEEDCGGDNLELVLVEHLADTFNKQLKGKDVRQFPKAMAKLKKQVKRLKEVLSANQEAGVTCEELLDGIDFRAMVTRTQMEELAGDLFDRAATPLKEILKRNGLTAEKVDAVELIGGGTRVPKLKAVLAEALGGRTLDMHLDADEAVVWGAGLFAANLSSAFRLRKFGMSDGVVYPIQFQMESGSKDGDKPKLLLPALKKLPVKRVVHLPEPAGDAVKFKLEYSGALPPGVQDPLMAQFEVTGIDAATTKYNDTESFKVNAHFKADVSGMLALDKVEALVDYNTQVPMKVSVPKSEGKDSSKEEGKAEAKEPETADSSSDGEPQDGESSTEDVSPEGSDPKDGSGDSGADKEDSSTLDDDKQQGSGEEAKEEKGDKKEEEKGDKKEEKGDKKEDKKKKEKVQYETIMVPKKKTAKVALTVGGPGFRMTGMSKDEIKSTMKLMADFVKMEEAKRETARAKNDLESYIIDMRDKVDADEEVAKFTTEDQRSEFSSKLTDMEDWLYMEGEHEEAPEFKKRLKELRKLGDPIFRRIREANERPDKVKTAKELTELLKKTVNAWETIKPWINATDKDALLEKILKFEDWLSAKEAEQSKLQDHEDPAFSVDEVVSQAADVQKAFSKLNNKKKPKPPPAPKKDIPSKEDQAGSEGAPEDKNETKQEGDASPEDSSTDADDMPSHDEL